MTEKIREPQVGKLASDFSALPQVRAYCSARQRAIGEKGDIVAEGRDMGTIVFPDARWKFFLTASAEERSRRRWLEGESQGHGVSQKEILQRILKRDQQDSNRKIAPLKSAPDAMKIDTTGIDIQQVVALIVSNIVKKD